MNLHVVVVAVSLGLSVWSSDCAPGHTDAPLPVLMRVGEEYRIRLDNSPSALDRKAPSRIQLQLTQRLSGGQIGGVGNGILSSPEDRERRSEDPPISLDLTFHLLREVLQMARAEKMTQRVTHNRKIMDDLGK
ncbi:corticoliberin-1 [Danio rerio]|uniref:Corticoliberin n=1 Tax=Danio rerio TaxID=7955 RepID=U5HSN7_DANRE|nr:corticoliberin [Danio rerio]AFH53997.1 corticotropin-releasing hormone [Danio rerio]|eukprot:XP_009297004.1 corticoliberin [Danio rerio]